MKKFFERYLLRKAGRAQLVGMIVLLLGATAFGRAHPALLEYLRDSGPGAIVAIIGIVAAVIAAVDADKVVAANTEEVKK